MYQPLSLFIGLRYFRAKRRNGFISFISFSSTIGIMLGVAVLIIGLSAMNGFEFQLKERLLGVIPHAELEAVSDPISNWRALYQLASRHKGVVAGAPYIKRSALLDNGNSLKALQLKAVLPEQELKVSQLAQFGGQQLWQTLTAGANHILLGASIAKQFNIQRGDRVTLLLPKADGSIKLRAPLRAAFTVSGIFSVGGQVDASMAYIHLADAQALLDMGHSVAGISLKVSDVMQADTIVKEAGQNLPHFLYLKSWFRSQGYLYQDILMVKSMMYVILLMVVAVACFNIVSTLVMAVKDKRSDIAILKTMGASNGTIQRIFMVQGLINAVLGAFFGAIIGVLVALNLSDAIKQLESLLQVQLLSGDIYFIDFIPSRLDWCDVAIVTVSALLMGLISTLYPAFAASRTQPAQELGHG